MDKNNQMWISHNHTYLSLIRTRDNQDRGINNKYHEFVKNLFDLDYDVRDVDIDIDIEF